MTLRLVSRPGAAELLENELRNWLHPTAASAAAIRVALWRQHALPGRMDGTPRPTAAAARFTLRQRHASKSGKAPARSRSHH